MFKKGFLSLCCLLLLSACTYPSGEKSLSAVPDKKQNTAPQDQGRPMAPGEAQALVQAALKASQSDAAQKFWYDGYIANNLQDQRTTSMYQGIVIRPDRYLVNGRVAGQSFRYYKAGDKAYFHNGVQWMNAEKQSVPFDPLQGFMDWASLFHNAKQMDDQELLSKPCTRIQVQIKAKEWLDRSHTPLFDQINELRKNNANIEDILSKTTVKMTLWIGKKDHLLYQYQTWIRMSIPAAGFMDQEIMFRFFKYNDPGIKVKEPADIEKYIINPKADQDKE